MEPSAEVVIRPATAADHPAVVELAGTALGWAPDQPNLELFRWKHVANPFGASPMWVAEHGDRLVAFRALLRWEFDDPERGRQRAVRPVDTATHPDHQGQGLFRRLTLGAVEVLQADGVDLAFNTPNDQSRPGYLSMGWVDVGRVPVAVDVRSPAALARMVRARVPAAKWSLAADVGEAAADVLADTPAVEELLGSQPAPRGLRTRRSPAFLRWRYADGPLAYRALLRSSDLADGVALFRLRSRGSATEATLCDVIVPGDDPRLVRELVAAVRRHARPDYVIQVRDRRHGRGGLPLPGQGPRLTGRALARADVPPRAGWDLRLGDIELF